MQIQKIEIESICIICNHSFLYKRLTAYQIRVTCGDKDCTKKARSIVTPGRFPWRKTKNVRTFND